MSNVVAILPVKKSTGIALSPTISTGASTIQGGSIMPLQGSAPSLQGSSPSLQVTANPMNYTLVPSAGVTTPPPDTTPLTNPLGGLGGGGGNAVADTTAAARAATQKSIDALGGAYTTGMSSINNNFNQIMSQYADQFKIDSAAHDDQTVKNERNRSNNIQQALNSAAIGGRGLNSVLASMGALNGTGELLARRAVASGANADIGGANKTFDDNATTLSTAWNSSLLADKNRKEQAKAAKSTEEAALKSSIAAQKQSLFQKMADLYAAIGNNTEAAKYLGMAGDLAVDALGSPAKTATYVPSTSVYSPTTLTNYLSGANDMTVKIGNKKIAGSSAPAINSPIYSETKKRENIT